MNHLKAALNLGMHAINNAQPQPVPSLTPAKIYKNNYPKKLPFWIELLIYEGAIQNSRKFTGESDRICAIAFFQSFVLVNRNDFQGSINNL
jgi:hypothetical protein